MRTVVVVEGRANLASQRLVWVWGLANQVPPGVERWWVTDPFGSAPVDVDLASVSLGDVLFDYQVRDSMLEGGG